MSDIKFEAARITTILREEAKPIKLPALLRVIIDNPNRKPTAKQRKELEAFMVANADVAGWKNPNGKAWTIVKAEATAPLLPPPVQGTLPAKGMAPYFEDQQMADLAHAWSCASQARSDAQRAEKKAEKALDDELRQRAQDDGERKEFRCQKASGVMTSVFWAHKPGTDGPSFTKGKKK